MQLIDTISGTYITICDFKHVFFRLDFKKLHKDISREIDEAALIDGASILRIISILRIMFQIILPQIAYGFMATWTFIFILT